MKDTFSVIFYLKRQAVKKDGTVSVMGRITAALEANRLLDKIRVRINKHYLSFLKFIVIKITCILFLHFNKNYSCPTK